MGHDRLGIGHHGVRKVFRHIHGFHGRDSQSLDSLDGGNGIDHLGQSGLGLEVLFSVNRCSMPESADKNAREHYFSVSEIDEPPGFLRHVNELL